MNNQHKVMKMMMSTFKCSHLIHDELVKSLDIMLRHTNPKTVKRFAERFFCYKSSIGVSTDRLSRRNIILDSTVNKKLLYSIISAPVSATHNFQLQQDVTLMTDHLVTLSERFKIDVVLEPALITYDGFIMQSHSMFDDYVKVMKLIYFDMMLKVIKDDFSYSDENIVDYMQIYDFISNRKDFLNHYRPSMLHTYVLKDQIEDEFIEYVKRSIQS